MAITLTSNKLIDSVRRRTMTPDNTEVFDPEDILNSANEEISTSLLPKLLSINEEYLVRHVDIPIVSGVNRYRIPYRAIGNKLRDVAIITTGGQVYELSQVSLEELSDYLNLAVSSYQNFVFYMEDDEVVFPSFNATGYASIRMYFYLRPSELVPDECAGKITSIDRVSGTITLENFPDDFLSLPEFDFVSAKTPNKLFAYDTPVVSVNKNTKTVIFDPSLIPAELAKNDYLCIANQTIVPQIPVEWHPLLAQAVATHILEALGDAQNFQMAESRLEKMEKNLMGLLENRVEGAPKKINQRHSNLIDAVSHNQRIGRIRR